MVDDKPWLLDFAEEEFSQRQKVVKQVFIRRKKYKTQGQTQRKRVFQNCSSLNDFYGTFLPGFLWPIIFIYLAANPHLVYLRILPYVHMDLSEHRF